MMKFRTETEVRPFGRPIGYDSRIFAAGSCFAESISARLAAAHFRVTTNPTGILFNPASIAAMLERVSECRMPDAGEIVCSGGRTFCFDAHSSLARHTPEQAAEALGDAIRRGHEALHAASHLIITLGTAWVYALKSDGRIVANCHKQPHSLFGRKRLGVSDTVNLLEPLMSGILRDKHVIMTVSPVRHTADTLAGNSASKAVLRLAIEELAARCPNVEYFPSFEIMNDDLRDYRFYGEDLVHPTPQAVEYIWELFSKAALSAEALALLPRVEKIVAATAHRPFDSASEEYRDFVRRTLDAIDALPQVDFSEERMNLEGILNKNK